MSWQGRERRKHPRASGTFDLHVTGPESSEKVRVKDISESGISCRTDRPFPEMSLVQIDLHLPEETESPAEQKPNDLLRCEGAVVRCAPAGDETFPTYDMAIFFTHVPQSGRERIAAFVEAQLSSPPGPSLT